MIFVGVPSFFPWLGGGRTVAFQIVGFYFTWNLTERPLQITVLLEGPCVSLHVDRAECNVTHKRLCNTHPHVHSELAHMICDVGQTGLLQPSTWKKVLKRHPQPIPDFSAVVLGLREPPACVKPPVPCAVA